MKITTVGRGSVGSGLAKLWEEAGHEVTTTGRGGGDASDADVILVAVPSNQIAEALENMTGIEGKVTIDACNAFHGRQGDYESLAHQVKELVGGPVAKAFNVNFADLYDQVAEQRVRPSNLYAADDEAREVVEQLSRDAGYKPVYVGGLDQARGMEDYLMGTYFAVMRGGMGRFFYRYGPPGEL
ncbi:MAG: dinucleotide-binding protein [Anaerolineae bacterium]|jgi:8-hydroxy-5-deazaflavin:NADPH oxidoreductase